MPASNVTLVLPNAINFDGNLADADMLKLENFTLFQGIGLMNGSMASGAVSAYDALTGGALTATAAITTTYTGSLVDSVTIVVTPQAEGEEVTTHLFERVANGAYAGVRYTRTEDGTPQSIEYYNTGTDAPPDTPLYGSFRQMNLDGSVETWDAPPVSFVWYADTTHVNGGYYTGSKVETHEYIPADSSQPKVVTVNTYAQIGDEDSYDKQVVVLLSEDVNHMLGTTALSTEVTRYGYDERVWLEPTTGYPDGRENDNFGKQVWRVDPDDQWTLSMPMKVPAWVQAYYYDAEFDQWVPETDEQGYPVMTVDLVYADPLVFTPWLDGPALPVDFGTRAGAEAFFAGLMAEAEANDFEIAGCRRMQTTAASTLEYAVAWNELRHTSIAGVMLGVEYSYDTSYSSLSTGDALGPVVLTNREERWNAGETAASWSAWSTRDVNFKVSLDHTGLARLSTTSLLDEGGTVNDSWQMVATAAGDGEYDEYHAPPSYTAEVDHPLWSTTTTDAQGRTVAETSKFSEAGTVIQTVTTTYTGETACTRTAGGVTLATQGEDVVASGQRTSVSTDAQGVVTTTVTDDATGAMISETRVGTDAGLNVTTNYAQSTNATTGETTQTVTQTADGITRTLSVTVTDAQGRTVSATDANGGMTSYDYTNQGRTVTASLPGGGTQVTVSYLDGQLKSITGTGVLAEYHHYTVNDGGDASYEAGSITETVYLGTDNGSAWRKTTTNYLGQVLREESPSPSPTGTGASVTTHSYNAKGQRVRTSSPGMADLIRAYDDWGRVSQQGYDMNADGVLTVSSTDVLTTSTTDYREAESTVLERVVRSQYTEDGTDTALQTTSERKLLEGTTWQRTTQPDGGVLLQQDAMSGSTRTVTAQQSVTGTQLQTQVYQNGLLMSETPPGMATAVTYEYTGFGELKTVAHPLNGTTTRTYYDATGQLHTQSQSGSGLSGSAETYSYVTAGNGLGQVATVTHADSSTTTYTYDVQGRVLTQSGTAEYALRHEYDSLGRRWKLHTYRDATPDLTQDGDLTTWEYYTGTNALLSKTDAASRSVSYTYDAAGHQLTRTNARSIVTTYGYDGIGRLTSVDYSDSTPDVTNIGYDRAGRRTSMTDAAGEHAFTYDATSVGQLDLWTVSGSGAWSGLAVDHDYTGGQRSNRATSLGATVLPGVGYTWNTASGQMATVTAGGTTATYRYNAGTGWNEGVDYTGGLSSTRSPDTLGRLDTVSWSAGAATVSGHDYTINAMNRRTDALRQDGSAWGYGYNDRGEVTSAAKGAEPGKQFAFEYDGLGNRTASKVSSLADPAVLRTTGYTPNGLNQYDAIAHPSPGWLVLRGSTSAAAGATVTVDGEATTTSGALWFYEKSVDNAAGPVRRTATIAASRPDGGINGGGVTTQRKGSVFIPPASEVPTYDWDGNLTSDARWNYTWDGENRLIAAEEKTGVTLQPAGGVVKRYRLELSYDAQGRRISKSVLVATGTGGFVLQQSLVMLYDGWNMIAEIDTTTTAQVLRSYEWGLDVSGTMTGAGGVRGLLIERFHAMPSIQQAASSHAPCYDGNGNITELVNLTDGSVSARYEYGAFGETISVDGGAVAAANPFRFSTKYLDRETGFYDYVHRLYIPQSARWLSRDPIEERGGINLHGMCGNDPVNRFDKLGLYTIQDAKDSLAKRGVKPENHYGGGFVPGFEFAYEPASSDYSDTQVFDEWLVLEGRSMKWYGSLPKCPKCISVSGGRASTPDSKVWSDPNFGLINGIVTSIYHPGAKFEMRTLKGASGSPSGNQCTYDDKGILLTSIPAAGTADRYGPNNDFSKHQDHDVKTFDLSKRLGRMTEYYWVRPIW